MKDMNELFDDDLRKRLRQYSEEPDTRLWDTIQTRVEEESRAHRLRKKIKNGWIFLLGMIMIGGLYSLVNSLPSENTSFDQVATEQNSMLERSNDAEAITKTVLPLLSPHSSSSTTTSSPENQITESFKDGVSQAVIAEEPEMVAIEMPGTTLENIERWSIENFNDGGNSTVTKETSIDVSIASIPVSKEEIEQKEESQPDNEERKKKKFPFNLYFTIMPTLGYQRIEPNSNDNLLIESIDRIATFSSDRLGVRAELGAEYPISNRVNIFGGFVYFQRQQTIGYTEKQVSETEISEGPNGDIILNPEFSYVHQSFEYEVRNIGWQIGVNYQLSKKKFLQTAGTGIEFHMALNKFEHAEEFTNNPSVYVFYNLYYRIQYPAETKLKAVMQPTLNYSFYINQNANAPFYVKPYGLGLNIGFTYNF
jgi:hypothetical protein